MAKIMALMKQHLPPSLLRKTARLRQGLRKLDGLLVAFSGGTDSTFLAALAHSELGAKALAVTVLSPIYSRREQSEAISLARRLRIAHLQVRMDVLSDPDFINNSEKRCYYCKRKLFRILTKLAKSKGLAAVADGTNQDDCQDLRPGRRAALQYGIISPLLDAGFTKNDIRRASLAMGLPTANKPPLACLASRFPYGSKITNRGLALVELLEEALWRWGFRQVRVRHHGLLARIEVGPAEIKRLCSSAIRKRLVALARQHGFVYITADLMGYRTGSLNETRPRRGRQQ